MQFFIARIYPERPTDMQGRRLTAPARYTRRGNTDRAAELARNNVRRRRQEDPDT